MYLRTWAQVVWVSVWLCGLPMQLRRHPLPHLLARLRRAQARQPSGTAEEFEQLVRLVVRVCHGRLFRLPLFPRACLRQSLALFYTLSRLGYAVTIHFGVRKDGAVLQGHSWVTVQGTPIAEGSSLEVFHRVYAYPVAVTSAAYTGLEPMHTGHTGGF